VPTNLSRAGYAFLCAASLCISFSARAQSPPSEFNYQGRLTDLAGAPITGTVSMTFQLYDTDVGGAPLWEETQALVSVDEGIFTVLLGSVEPFDAWGIEFSQQYWLAIEVAGDPMGERMPVVPVPTAHYAINAGMLEGVVVGELEESQEIEDAIDQHEDDHHGGNGADSPWIFVHGGNYADVMCGVRATGRAECWGENHLYLPDTYTQVVSGQDHVCALKQDGILVCYGDDDHGQGTPPAGTFTQVSAAVNHNCAVKTDQTLECWGSDLYGQASPPAGTFIQVDATAYDSCAVTTAGEVECWGNHGASLLPQGPYTQVAASLSYECAIREDGSVECTGYTPPAGSFLQIDGSHNTFCGIKDDLSIECWGDDQVYKHMSPVGSFSFLNSSHSSTCAIDTEGELLCWGSNTSGHCSPP
jgi:alpha-tubulin suppressor-like RCC1 family protein